jgi:hypothetical protein
MNYGHEFSQKARIFVAGRFFARPLQGMAHRLEIQRARYSPAMRKQQTHFFHIHHIALPEALHCCARGRAPTIERAAFG